MPRGRPATLLSLRIPAPLLARVEALSWFLSGRTRSARLVEVLKIGVKLVEGHAEADLRLREHDTPKA